MAPQLRPGAEGPGTARVLAGIDQVVNMGLHVIKGVSFVLFLCSTLMTDPESSLSALNFRLFFVVMTKQLKVFGKVDYLLQTRGSGPGLCPGFC